jgi:acyl-ACP thioesterase
MSATASEPAPALVARPASGRVFTETRKVRLADVSPGGRLRLDSATRYLQDLSADDTADSALPDAESWVVRKTVLEVRSFPRYLEVLDLATWCSGTGSHWAERRITMVGRSGGHIEAATTWVHVDPATGRPKRVPESFEALYGEAAGGRRVKARLQHAGPPAGAASMAWPLRFTDFDVLSHVNNAAYWEPVEEVLAGQRDLRAPLHAEVEHPTAVERGAQVEVAFARGEADLSVWVVADGAVAASARLQRL